MSITRILSESVPEPPPNTFSNCLVVGDQVFMSGQCSLGENAYEQSKSIFQNIKSLMEAAGGSMADVVKFNVYLTDINDREQVSAARSEFFEGDFPTSTLVEVSKLVYLPLKVEIEATAILGVNSD